MTPSFPRSGVSGHAGAVQTGLSLRRFLRTLKPLRSATIDLNGVIATYPPALNTEVKTILDALNAEDSRH